jgi:transcriptional regulator with XRE-family HTH domain
MVSSSKLRADHAPRWRTRNEVPLQAIHARRLALTLSAVLDDPTRRARLAYAIRSARDRRKLTPPQLAERLNVGRGTVNKWESGEQVPSLLMLGPLCDALGVDANLFAVLPPIPAWEGETYLMDDPADRAARAALATDAPPEQGAGGAQDGPGRPAPAQS